MLIPFISLFLPCVSHFLISECDAKIGQNALTSVYPFNARPCQNGSIHGQYGRKRKIAKRQSPIIGIACNENIDCQTTEGGAFCDTNKKCECLPAFVNINGFCWQKSQPGDQCAYEEQCTGASANSYCHSSGICMCTNNQQPTLTEDGPVCIIPGECPTNGANSKFRGITGDVIGCNGGWHYCVDTGNPSAITDNQEYVYNCLCPPAGPDCSIATVPTYCCPKRALACIQPKDEGTFGPGAGSSELRWWYNSATGNCDILQYRGTGGNGNNFHSKALCETYCKTVCPRGNPLYNPSKTSILHEIGTCTGIGQCPDDFECHTGKGISSICCPINKFICSPQGGIPSKLSTSPDRGDQNYNSQKFTRFYYSNGRCLPFSYYGLGGNFNNFQSMAECLLYCGQTSCKAGMPLRDSNGEIVSCGNGCPMKYFCTSSDVCCPSIDFVCSQSQAIGGCGNFVDRWWYNPSIRSCEKFLYSGCHGNDNNFPTYKECSDFCGASAARVKCPQGEPAKTSNEIGFIVCMGNFIKTENACPSDYYCHFDGKVSGCCPTRTKTCSMDQADPGTPCITPITRWYYNSQTRQCDIFTYNGCDGNSNNFGAKIDCQDYCGVGGCPEGGEPYHDRGNGLYKICVPSSDSCPDGFKCTTVSLGSLMKRDHCCPTRAHVCSLSQDQGQRCGTSTLNRYFFNSLSKTCEQFTYNGCEGNRNNFASSDQCMNYCNSAGCPAGQVVSEDSNSRRVITCDPNSPNCSPGYACVYSAFMNQGICCGSNEPTGSCLVGQTAYMDAFTNTPLQCQPNADSCPAGNNCYYSFSLQNSFCCGNTAAQCPQGGTHYLDSNNQPTQCTPNLMKACPSGYACQANTVEIGGIKSTVGYCCGHPNACGQGYTLSYVNNQPISCSANDTQSPCPSQSICVKNSNNQRSYCCVASVQVTTVCLGKEAYMVQGAPTICNITSPSTVCPQGFTCDFYPPTNTYYCCAVKMEIANVTACPNPYTLLEPVRPCSPGVIGSCPINAFCSFDTISNRYVCCQGSTPSTAQPITNPCPNGQPYVNQIGQAQICRLGGWSGCPAQFGCAYSSKLRNYYCCTGAPRPTPIMPGNGAGRFG